MGYGTTAPLIAVTGRRRSAKGLHDGHPSLDALAIESYFTSYSEHVAAAGGIPVHVPAAADPAALMERVDALVLTGGTDIDPARYGAAADATTLPADPGRDALELALLDAAEALDRPVLAICRGVQLVNVACGGTLHAHLGEHPPGRWHDVSVEPGSLLHRLVGPASRVNSLHHQSVDRVGAGLAAVAWSPDGVVEAVERADGRLLGVQWHPEQIDPAPQPVFRWLVDVVRASSPGTIRVLHGATA